MLNAGGRTFLMASKSAKGQTIEIGTERDKDRLRELLFRKTEQALSTHAHCLLLNGLCLKSFNVAGDLRHNESFDSNNGLAHTRLCAQVPRAVPNTGAFSKLTGQSTARKMRRLTGPFCAYSNSIWRKRTDSAAQSFVL